METGVVWFLLETVLPQLNDSLTFTADISLGLEFFVANL